VHKIDSDVRIVAVDWLRLSLTVKMFLMVQALPLVVLVLVPELDEKYEDVTKNVISIKNILS